MKISGSGLPVEAVWEQTDDPEIAMMQWRPAAGTIIPDEGE